MCFPSLSFHTLVFWSTYTLFLRWAALKRTVSTSSFLSLCSSQVEKKKIIKLFLFHSFFSSVESVLSPQSIPLWFWSKCGRIWSPAGCAGRGRTVSSRARLPSSPSWCGRCWRGSASDTAAETPTTAGPTPPYCFFLKGGGKEASALNLFTFTGEIQKQHPQLHDNIWSNQWIQF